MINWRELPFLRLLLPFAAGIYLSYHCHFNHPVLIYGLPILLLVLAKMSTKLRGMYRHRWLYGCILVVLLFFGGYQVGHFYDARNADSFFGKNLNESENYFAVQIDDAPVKKGDWVRLKVEVKAFGESENFLQESTGKILLYVSRDENSDRIKYGDRLVFSGKVNAVDPPMNPDAFDFQKYLRYQNIYHQSFVREGNWQVVGNGYGNPFFAKAIDWQSYFLKTLRKHLPTENELAVGSALILGYRSEIPEEVKTAYANTGAMHVLAVSGLHVGIVFLVLNFFIKRIPLHDRWWHFLKAVLVLSGIWAFALVTGLSPSVTRAAVMFSCVQVGLAMRRDSNVYNTLLASAFIMLLFNPFALASVSFQLSYLAVLGIVFFQEKLAKLLFVRNRILDKIWQLFCVSVAAQFMLIPLTLYYFHQFPTYFWLSSLLLVPLAGFELTAGILLLFFEAVWSEMAIVLGKLLWLMLWVGNEFVLFVQTLPGALIDGIWIGGLTVVLLYLAVSQLMIGMASKKMKWLVSALVFLTVVSIHFAFVSWDKSKAQQLVIYDINRHTALDIFDEEEVVCLLSENIDRKTLQYATESHRFAMGMKSLHTISLTSAESYREGHLFYENKFLQFGEIKMAIVSAPILFEVEEKIKLDYILVSGSPKVSIEEIQSVYAFEEIIFDRSNKKWKVEEWKEKCEVLGVEYYDVGEEGAFVLDL